MRVSCFWKSFYCVSFNILSLLWVSFFWHSNESKLFKLPTNIIVSVILLIVTVFSVILPNTLFLCAIILNFIVLFGFALIVIVVSAILRNVILVHVTLPTIILVPFCWMQFWYMSYYQLSLLVSFFWISFCLVKAPTLKFTLLSVTLLRVILHNDLAPHQDPSQSRHNLVDAILTFDWKNLGMSYKAILSPPMPVANTPPP